MSIIPRDNSFVNRLMKLERIYFYHNEKKEINLSFHHT